MDLDLRQARKTVEQGSCSPGQMRFYFVVFSVNLSKIHGQIGDFHSTDNYRISVLVAMKSGSVLIRSRRGNESFNEVSDFLCRYTMKKTKRIAGANNFLRADCWRSSARSVWIVDARNIMAGMPGMALARQQNGQAVKPVQGWKSRSA